MYAISVIVFLFQNRRRSQRNAGQRKRYVDDLNIPISDDELMEDVMSTRPPRKKDYKVIGYCNVWKTLSHLGECVGIWQARGQ